QPYQQQPYPPQYAPPPPPQANPLSDPARYARWEKLINTSRKLRTGGKVGLGVGIPFLVIGLSVGIVAVYNNGVYLCSGVSCDRTAAAAAGFTLAVLGAAGVGAGIAMLVIGNQYYDRAERVRMGLDAMKWVPLTSPLVRAYGRGLDGAARAR